MSKPCILIIGDSFAADWTVKYNLYPGWPNLLADKYDVTNLAQAGISEYKIYKQLLSVENLDTFDFIIVAHTSPYRVVTKYHPIHAGDLLHNHADLMISDIDYHGKQIKNIFNFALRAAKNFFIYHFDEDFFKTTYQLFREKINLLLKDKKVIVFSNLLGLEEFTTENVVLNFSSILSTEGGIINHFSEEGNKLIYQTMVNTIENFK